MAIYKNNSSYVMKKNNEQKVLNLIYKSQPIYRAQIAERTNLTQQSVTNIVRRLINNKLVIECPTESTSVGRNPINLQINNANLFSIGIEVSTIWISGVLIDFNERIISKQKIFIGKKVEETTCCDILLKIIGYLLNSIEDRDKVKGIGISIEGIVDKGNGVVVQAKRFGWENYRLKEIIQEKYGLPVWLENDVNMIAVVENGSGRLINSVDNITIRFDQGIGAAIVFDKKLYTGSNHIAGEFGHYKSFYGEKAKSCACGGKGCLTTVASIGSLEENFNMDFDEIIKRVNSGEKLFVETITGIGETIGLALANIINFFNPDKVLLTGRFLDKTGNLILPIIKKIVYDNILNFCKNVEIKEMVLEGIAAMAAKLVIEDTFRVPEAESNNN